MVSGFNLSSAAVFTFFTEERRRRKNDDDDDDNDEADGGGGWRSLWGTKVLFLTSSPRPAQSLKWAFVAHS